jgi:mono/diheme cytochrome c family protein
MSLVLAATSVQKTFGLILAPLVIIGFVVYFIVNMRKARPELGNEIELAANRKPYYDDETLEGPRLDRYLTASLVLLGVIAVGLPLYWLAEPGRQQGQIDRFEEIFASRGETEFEANCVSCHAAGGVGGVAAYVLNDKDGNFVANVSWKAPALNNALLRFDRDEIQYVLDHGRAFSPMQPWSTVGGGSKNEQQIQNIIDYLQSITITPDEAQREATDGVVDRLIQERAAAIDTENPQRAGEAAAAYTQRIGQLKSEDETLVEAVFERSDTLGAALVELGEANTAAAAQVKLGELMFNNGASAGSYSCARCHTPGWSYDLPENTGIGAFGPSLIGVAHKFKDAAEFQEFIAEGCEVGLVYGVVAPNGAQTQCKSGQMPGFGQMYSQEQIAAVVAYVSSLTGEERWVPTPGAEEGTDQ